MGQFYFQGIKNIKSFNLYYLKILIHSFAVAIPLEGEIEFDNQIFLDFKK